MRVNVNHPTFISFLEQVTKAVLSNISIENYFSLTPEKKINVQYLTLKLIKNSTKMRGTMSDDELKDFTVLLCKKNEESENYEFASILNDIHNNFQKINELTIPKKKPNKQIKIENKE